MKSILCMLLLAASTSMLACQNTTTTYSSAAGVSQGKTLGNSDVHVSGYIQSGGTAVVH